MVDLFTLMEKYIKEIGKKIQKMNMEFILIWMEHNTKDTGN